MIRDITRKKARETAALAYINQRGSFDVSSVDEMIELRDIAVEQARMASSSSTEAKKDAAFLSDGIDIALCRGQKVEKEWIDETREECVTVSGALSRACPCGNVLCVEGKCMWNVADVARDSALLARDRIADSGKGEDWFVTVTHRESVSLSTGSRYSTESVNEITAWVNKVGGKIIIATQEIPLKRLMTDKAKFWAHAHLVVWLPQGVDFKLRMDRRDVVAKKIYGGVEGVVKMIDYSLKGWSVRERPLAELLDVNSSLNHVDLLDLIGLASEDNAGEALIAAGERALKHYLVFLKWSLGGRNRATRVKGTDVIRAPRRSKNAPVSKTYINTRMAAWRAKGDYDPRILMGEAFSVELTAKLEGKDRVNVPRHDELFTDFDNAPEIAVYSEDELIAMEAAQEDEWDDIDFDNAVITAAQNIVETESIAVAVEYIENIDDMVAVAEMGRQEVREFPPGPDIESILEDIFSKFS